MFGLDYIAVALGHRSPRLNFGGGGNSSGETLQQKQLATQQALTTANLNLQENQQRKSMLNSMLGTRVFRGSALSRALVGNTPGQGGENATPAPSASQTSAPVTVSQQSLLDQRVSNASGRGGAGGAGASASPSTGGASHGSVTVPGMGLVNY